MSVTKIYLTLVKTDTSYELKWSNDQSSWSKVQSNSPSTGVNSGDEIDWDADDTIDKVKIKFKKGNIIPDANVSGNDTKKPKGVAKADLPDGLSDTYTIKVKPADGGPSAEYDPDIRTPKS